MQYKNVLILLTLKNDDVMKKFVESFKIDDYEVLTDDGFKDFYFIHKKID